ncbi:MAG TPA: hypothetical protein VF796_14060 [Humisphaera sp.]
MNRTTGIVPNRNAITPPTGSAHLAVSGTTKSGIAGGGTANAAAADANNRRGSSPSTALVAACALTGATWPGVWDRNFGIVHLVKVSTGRACGSSAPTRSDM